ncbi:uncharacterized protein AC631_04896 [Debaryomyces fabryi]|uniref:Nuclear condensin complex subunit 3 C-terminal domain-containing protein n=1 Tax=Debaryomyces fabryi TaxID=58627 RepID=A0A0V1PSW4_9ASCO|nr:uncharacterized protein AC631_04896 [Debaryomyces fabryi]KRZ99350.1 hypothetical protein AC631_04896 [Debaryomyces fabryi]CUM47966.1 unnamed protein product [Debaryomyces fabryi]
MTTEKPTLTSIKKINDLDSIRYAMAHVFQDAQLSLSGHRKLVIVLKNIQQRAISLGYEEGFTLKFVKLLNKILPLKKGEQVADRVAKFCSMFVSSLYKDEEIVKDKKKNGKENDSDMSSEDSDSDSEEETPAGRFVDYLLRHLLRGIQAKDKNVRYRVVQLLAYIVNYIGEIDEELFKALHWSLNRRLFDKEANVRIQAVVAISSFQYINLTEEGEYSADNQVNKATQSLLIAIQNDDSAEVRRAALLNLAKNQVTIPFLLERARDVNSINRRLVYSRILKELGDFRDIDFQLRENLLKWGLNDRDDSVQKSAIKMFSSTWLDIVDNDLIELIENLKVVDSDIADTAMMTFYRERADKLSSIEISESSWKELTTEKAFLIRTFYEHCNENNLYDLIEKNFPESIELADLLYKYLNLRKQIIDSNSELIEAYESYKTSLQEVDSKSQQIQYEEHELFQDIDNIEDSKEKKQKISQAKKLKKEFQKLANEKKQLMEGNKEMDEEYTTFHEQLKDLEFVIQQLLLISKQYDFSDEIGRRKMLQIIRSSLANDKLTDKLIESSLKVLRKISINERDFLAMCTEIVTDIRDSYMDENDEDTFHSAISGFRNSDSEDEEDEEDNDKQEIGDNTDGSKKGSQPHKKRKTEPKQAPDDIIIQCLLITQHLLELTEESLENNYSLGSLIESLVRPAVLRNEQPVIRSLGLKCLGLFSLLEKQLAIENLYLFGMAATKADEELRIICVKIIVDILSTYGVSVLDIEGGVDSLSLARLFYKILRIYEMPNLQCVVAEGLCKLFLADILTDFGKSEKLNANEDEEEAIDEDEDEDEEEDDDDMEMKERKARKRGAREKKKEEDQEKQLFETLILTYFHPLNTSNHALRQTLAFCIPVYAFSHPTHQDKVASISGDCFFRMFREGGEFSKYDNIAPATSIIQQLIHWCDPNNLVNLTQVEIKKSPAHFWQSMGFLQAIEQDTPKNIKKIIINNLNKLYITEELGSTILKGLLNAIEDTKSMIESSQHDPDFIFDALTEKNFDKFHQSIKDLIYKAEQIEAESSKNEQKNLFISDKSFQLTNSLVIDKDALRELDESPEDKHEKSSPGEATASNEDVERREESLHEIDKMLEEEENVDYNLAIDTD